MNRIPQKLYVAITSVMTNVAKVKRAVHWEFASVREDEMEMLSSCFLQLAVYKRKRVKILYVLKIQNFVCPWIQKLRAHGRSWTVKRKK